MIGGGQLARMTHQAAISLGQSLHVLAADESDSAAVVTPRTTVGDWSDAADVLAFAEGKTAVTFDHEHVPQEVLRALEDAGVRIEPGADALLYAQDKQAMRERLSKLDLPMPRWAPVSSVSDVEAFGYPCVLKAATGGYDGKGVWMVDNPTEAQEVLSSGVRLIAEERVPLLREVAVQIARTPSGETRVYPVVETVQRDGICVATIAPARIGEELEAEARRVAETVASELGVTGMLAIELFQTNDGLLINELAMRPHNSGHWTIEGAVTSQFEQHLRAVLDYPLGSADLTAPVVVMANILGGPDGGPRLDERIQKMAAEIPEARLHLYGKAIRPGRKIGHVTVSGADVDSARRSALRAAQWIREGR